MPNWGGQLTELLQASQPTAPPPPPPPPPPVDVYAVGGNPRRRVRIVKPPADWWWWKYLRRLRGTPEPPVRASDFEFEAEDVPDLAGEEVEFAELMEIL